MKSLQELAELREKMKSKVAVREGHNDIRIVVGMATCGIAAGARQAGCQRAYQGRQARLRIHDR
jgi:hypothetical protein